jgi:hypothetical protein
MRLRKGPRLMLAMLAGAVGLLVLVNGYLIQSPIDISPVAPAARKDEAPPAGEKELKTALDQKSVEQFQQTVARPLFDPSRRPVQRDRNIPAEAKVDSPELRLIGIMKSDGAPPRALIRVADEPTGKWIAEGATFNGWTLRKVRARSVIVESSGRTQELTFAASKRAPD